MPATLDDVASMVAALPSTAEGERHGGRTWLVAGKVFAWERGYSKADLKRAADAGAVLPRPPLVAVRTADLHDKEAMLAAEHKGVFVISHFDGYPAVLVDLRSVGKRVLRELLLDGWTALAPAGLLEELGRRRRGDGGDAVRA